MVPLKRRAFERAARFNFSLRKNWIINREEGKNGAKSRIIAGIWRIIMRLSLLREGVRGLMAVSKAVRKGWAGL